MPITIGRNIASLQAQRQLAQSSESLSRVSERLASGQRINRASDDAAGLSIASSLRSDARVYNQALRNVNDGVSALSIAEGAMHSLTDVTTRILELAEQSANGTYTSTQRSAMDTEAQALRLEFNRILSSTSYNGISLLRDPNTTINLQVGINGQTTSQLSVALGSPVTTVVGDGTFQAEQITDVTGTAITQNVASGDINGDGYLDLIWSRASTTMTTMLGNGDGSFKAATSFTVSTGSTNRRISLIDLNGDGALDYLGTSQTATNAAVVMLGNGNGTFAGTVSYAVGQAAAVTNSFTAADLNQDGKLDLLSYDTTNNVLNVALNNGNGTFQAGAQVSTNVSFGNDFAVGDMNGDSNLDVVVVGSTNRVLLGNGNGTFAQGGLVSFSSTRDPSLVDFNGDGRLDLVATASGIVEVALSSGSGTFAASTQYTVGTSGFPYGNLDTADFNGDGRTDIVTADATNGSISILLNNGNGTFKARSSYTLTNTADTLTLGDFTGDGVTDIVVGANAAQKITLFKANSQSVGGLGTFSLLTQAGAQSALTSVRSTLDQITSSIGNLGAYQSRLEIAAQSIQTSRENVLAAASRITDTDVAADAAQMVRLGILQQTATAILAQANLEPQIVLKLLS